MPAARGADRADQIRPAAERGGIRLQPADREMIVGDRDRIDAFRRLAEFRRRDDDAGGRERVVDIRVAVAVVQHPAAAVDVDRGGERPLAFRPRDAQRHRAAVRARAFVLLDDHVVAGLDRILHVPVSLTCQYAARVPSQRAQRRVPQWSTRGVRRGCLYAARSAPLRRPGEVHVVVARVVADVAVHLAGTTSRRAGSA